MQGARHWAALAYRGFQAGVFTRRLGACAAAVILGLLTPQLAITQPSAISREYLPYDQPDDNDVCASTLICDLTYSISECRGKAVSAFGKGNFYLYRASRELQGPIPVLAIGAVVARRYLDAGCLARGARATSRPDLAAASLNASIVVYSKNHGAFFDNADTFFWSNPDRTTAWIDLFGRGTYYLAPQPCADPNLIPGPGGTGCVRVPEESQKPIILPPTRGLPPAPSIAPPTQSARLDRFTVVRISIYGPGYVKTSDGKQSCRVGDPSSPRSTLCRFRVPRKSTLTFIAKSLPGGRFLRWNYDRISERPVNSITLPAKDGERSAAAYFIRATSRWPISTPTVPAASGTPPKNQQDL